MYICKYCGRVLKTHYDQCPGCGSTSFQTTSFIGEKIIEHPPKNGYILKTTNYERSKKLANTWKWIGIAFIVLTIMFLLPFFIVGSLTISEDKIFGFGFIVLPLLMELFFILIGVGIIIGAKKSQKKAQEDINRVNKLAQNGLLVKNMPYELTHSGTEINGKVIYCIKVVYKNATGQEIPLISEAKYDNKLGNDKGTVDLLIDPQDYSNYYIDFEIY